MLPKIFMFDFIFCVYYFSNSTKSLLHKLDDNQAFKTDNFRCKIKYVNAL